MVATILYVEDNPQNMRLIKKMLSAMDYEVIEATSGAIGLELAAQHHPDLILMDINLPDIVGTEVAQRIKANPQLTHIPIIALTANAMHGDRERFLTEGCDGYIAKPVSRNELLNTIAYFLEKRTN
jgi:two-component system, cell cycle response regulator DivK